MYATALLLFDTIIAAMEDAHTTLLQLDPDHPDLAFFAVFDGHGGTLTITHPAHSIP